LERPLSDAFPKRISCSITRYAYPLLLLLLLLLLLMMMTVYFSEGGLRPNLP